MRQTVYLLLAFLMLCAPSAEAQDEVVYRLELGAGIGGGFSLNDVNSKWYGKTGLAADLIARFPLNPRMAIKTQLAYQTVKGSTDNASRFYPANPNVSGAERLSYSVSGGLFDLSGMYELHFLPYGYERGYQGYRRIVPYIQMGVGLCYATEGNLSLQLPFGVGIKYKIGPRLNLGLDWTMHLTLTDKIDGLDAPLGISSSGFRNKDHYSQTLITLTYDLNPKCPTCNKD